MESKSEQPAHDVYCLCVLQVHMLRSFPDSFHSTHSLLSHLVGILAGHLYFFVMYKYPQDFGGQVLIAAPQIL